MRVVSPWVAIVAGVAATWVVLVIAGGAGWLVLRDATEPVPGRAAAAWGAGSAVFAFALGGWTATRLARSRSRRGARLGLLVGLLALTVPVAVAWVILRDAADFWSLGVELGLVEVASPESAPVPDSRAPGEPEGIDLIALARARTIAALGYLVALVALLVAAAMLGGLSGRGPCALIATKAEKS